MGWQDDWNTYLVEHYDAPSTRRSAEQHVRMFVSWWKQSSQDVFEPAKMTTYDLREFQRACIHDDKLSANTWNARLWALHVFCEFAGLPDLAHGLQMQRVGYKVGKNRSLTRAERLALMRDLELRVRGARTEFETKTALMVQAAVALMIYAGLRVAEIALMHVDDVRIIGGRTWIVTVRHGKGDKERDAHLGKEARRLLGLWLDYRNSHDMDDESMFGVSVRSLQRYVKRAGARAGIDGLTPHWLRYTFAKRLEKEFGATLEEIRDLLGHASIETTRRYLASGVEVKQALVEEM